MKTTSEGQSTLRHQIETVARSVIMIRGLIEPDPSTVNRIVADVLRIMEQDRDLRIEEQLERLIARVAASLP